MQEQGTNWGTDPGTNAVTGTDAGTRWGTDLKPGTNWGTDAGTNAGTGTDAGTDQELIWNKEQWK